MDHRPIYAAELAKLDQLEGHYWHCWEACDQAERRNLKYLDGIRWCMSHRLKLLAKLERLEPPQAEAPASSPVAAASSANPAKTNHAAIKQSPELQKVIRRTAAEMKRASKAASKRNGAPSPTLNEQLLAPVERQSCVIRHSSLPEMPTTNARTFRPGRLPCC